MAKFDTIRFLEVFFWLFLELLPSSDSEESLLYLDFSFNLLEVLELLEILENLLIKSLPQFDASSELSLLFELSIFESESETIKLCLKIRNKVCKIPLLIYIFL